jgi:hypothetical protein
VPNDYYIYCYFRLTGEPCYIGKGRGVRWKDHLTKAHNIHLRRIIAKAGGEIPHVKLCTGLNGEQALQYEIAWITAIGRGTKGPLVNMTDGGDGSLGCIPSSESRAKMSLSNRRPRHTNESKKKISDARVNRVQTYKHSEQTLQKIRAWHVGKIIPEEVKAKLRKPKTEAHKAALSAAKRGKPWSEARRAAYEQRKHDS